MKELSGVSEALGCLIWKLRKIRGPTTDLNIVGLLELGHPRHESRMYRNRRIVTRKAQIEGSCFERPTGRPLKGLEFRGSRAAPSLRVEEGFEARCQSISENQPLRNSLVESFSCTRCHAS